ncbi:hypothetical protein PWT90_00787 [Aphanocladium album]|nr:hypothetical protein PWT90_00787 [Aphanocladium album]
MSSSQKQRPTSSTSVKSHPRHNKSHSASSSDAASTAEAGQTVEKPRVSQSQASRSAAEETISQTFVLPQRRQGRYTGSDSQRVLLSETGDETSATRDKDSSDGEQGSRHGNSDSKNSTSDSSSNRGSTGSASSCSWAMDQFLGPDDMNSYVPIFARPEHSDRKAAKAYYKARAQPVVDDVDRAMGGSGCN